MIISNDFKTGMTIIYDDGIYQVLEFQHVKPGKGQAYIRTKLKNLRTGATTIETIQTGIKIENANVEKKKMQFIYDAGDSFAFMDMESFEEIQIPSTRLTYEKNFLKEGMEVLIVTYEDEILGVNVPEKVTLEVVECDPNVKGNSVQSALKNAVLETGFKVLVPLFIEVGDQIVVNTVEGRYCQRA